MRNQPHGSGEKFFLPTEFQLAAAGAMWPPSDRRIEAIRIAASCPPDWERLLRVARRHRVVGLVYDGLTPARPNVLPEIALEIAGQTTTLIRESLSLASRSIAVTEPIR